MRHLLGVVLAILTVASLPASAHAQRITSGRSTPAVTAAGFPSIVPGSTTLGSWATTAQPANQGSPGDFGYGETAVAVWDLPDYLDYNSTQAICVYAKHLSDVNHVDIAVNGGSFVTATFTSMSPNGPEPAYCANLDPTAFPTDRNWEARAIVYPNSGVPLVLQGTARNDRNNVASLYGTANSRGQLFHGTYSVYTTGVDSPSCGTSGGSVGACLTISQAMQNAMVDGGGDMGGATICWGPNSNVTWFGDTNTAFTSAFRAVNFQPCAGVTKAQVTITDADNAHGVRVSKQHLSHVNWISQGTGSQWNASGLSAAIADDVTYVGRGKGIADQLFTGGNNSLFARDTEISQTGDGFNVCVLAVRVKVHDIDSDSWSRCGAVLEPLGDATYDYNVEESYTPPGSAVFVTGNTHATTTIDGISNTSQFKVGSGVLDAPGATACFPVASVVTAVFANSITVTPAPTCTESGAILQTGSHADIYQTNELYFTATGTAGASTITITPGTGTPFIGGIVWDNDDLPTTATSPFVNPHLSPFTQLLSYNSGTGVATLSSPILISFTSRSLYTGVNNTVVYGLTATNWVDSQGIFQGADMGNIVLDHVTINNQVLATIADPTQQLSDMHNGGHWRNAIFDTVNFAGPNNDSSAQGQNVLFKNTVCAAISPLAHTGYTYQGSTSCKYP